jgi:hypothetical protein
MLLDAATIRDLEILEPLSRNGQTVWSLVNRTRTRAGRKALRDCLVATTRSCDEILARQDAHQELANHSAAFSTAIWRTGCEGLEQYLHLNWQLPDASAKIRRCSVRCGEARGTGITSGKSGKGVGPWKRSFTPHRNFRICWRTADPIFCDAPRRLFQHCSRHQKRERC